MIITLKNGDKVELDYNFYILKYLEEYKGGYKQLEKDMKNRRNNFELISTVIYALLRSNYEKPLSIDEAIRLVEMKDIPRITDWFYEELKKQNDYKKKSKFTNQKSQR